MSTTARIANLRARLGRLLDDEAAEVVRHESRRRTLDGRIARARGAIRELENRVPLTSIGPSGIGGEYQRQS